MVPISSRRLEVEAGRAGRCAELRAMLTTLAGDCVRRTSRVLEIGCGHGHFLEAYAHHFTDHFCIGIDYCADRSRRAQRKQSRNRHGNLQFIRAEAWEFLDAVPAEMTFERVFLLFPDPWPKRRHQKYRLMSPRFLSRLSTCVGVGGHLHFRTDATAYFAEAVETVRTHSQWQLDTAAPWPFEQKTVFQAKAREFQSFTAVNVSRAKA